MKIFILLFSCLSLFALFYPAFADEAAPDNSNWGIQPLTEDQQKTKVISSEEKIWNKEQDKNIYENYGSEESPAFLNRENINPGEADYNYGSGDGVD